MKRLWRKAFPKRGLMHTGEAYPRGSLGAQVEQLNLELDNLRVQLWIAILDKPPFRWLHDHPSDHGFWGDNDGGRGYPG